MAGDRYSIQAQNEVYYSTFTIVHWMDVFIRNDYRDVIVENLNYCIEHKGLEVYCWCLMTSHLHLIAKAEERYELSGIYRDFKKHTSKKIIEKIQEISESRREWLNRGMIKKINDGKIEKIFWKPDNHNIIIYPQSPHIFEQKKSYIHNNPLEAGFVEEPQYWKYSSAKNYLGIKGMVNIILG